MDGSRSARFRGLLQALLRHEVNFLVAGGVAAHLEGAQIVTLCLEILYDKTPENLDRLLGLVQELKARYRDPAGRHIEPDLAKLQTLRTHLLLTELGALDLLSEIGASRTYQDLAGRTILYELGEDRVRVLELSAVIESKEQANRDKDRAVLPVLRQTLVLKTGLLRRGEQS